MFNFDAPGWMFKTLVTLLVIAVTLVLSSLTTVYLLWDKLDFSDEHTQPMVKQNADARQDAFHVPWYCDTETPKNPFRRLLKNWVSMRCLKAAIEFLMMAITAALVGDNGLVHQIRVETFEDLEGESDVITNNGYRAGMAIALAISGDIDNAWTEIESLVNQPSGFTPWQLKLHPGFKIWFVGIPAYQEFTKGLVLPEQR